MIDNHRCQDIACQFRVTDRSFVMKPRVNIAGIRDPALQRPADCEKTLQVLQRSSLRHAPKRKASLEETVPQIRLSQIGEVVKPPLELDLEIQTERVLRVLDSTIESLEVLVSGTLSRKIVAQKAGFQMWLPLMLKKGRSFLGRYFTEEEVQFIFSTCSPYIETVESKERIPTEISTVIDEIRIQKTTRRRTTAALPSQLVKSKRPSISRRKASTADEGAGRSDFHMCYLVELVCSNQALRRCLQKQNPLEESNVTLFLEQMRRLKEIAEYKFSSSALQEAEREKALRKAFRLNQDASDDIQSECKAPID